MNTPAVSNCIIVRKKSLWGYRGDDEVPFIKIICSEPKALPKAKDKFSLILLEPVLIFLYVSLSEDRWSTRGYSLKKS